MLQFYTRFTVLLPVICGVQLLNQVHIASLSSGPSLPGAWLPTRKGETSETWEFLMSILAIETSPPKITMYPGFVEWGQDGDC